MKHYRLVLTVAMAALMASGMAVAAEIYKWTDTDGNVHYEDRPTGDAVVERLDVVSRGKRRCSPGRFRGAARDEQSRNSG